MPMPIVTGGASSFRPIPTALAVGLLVCLCISIPIGILALIDLHRAEPGSKTFHKYFSDSTRLTFAAFVPWIVFILVALVAAIFNAA